MRFISRLFYTRKQREVCFKGKNSNITSTPTVREIKKSNVKQSSHKGRETVVLLGIITFSNALFEEIIPSPVGI